MGNMPEELKQILLKVKNLFHLIVLIWLTALYKHLEKRNIIQKVKHPTHYAQLACA